MDNDTLSSKTSANYDGFSLVSGGLIYSITKIFRRKAKPGRELISTAVALALITWLPLCIFALIGGTIHDDASTISFFEDFLMHVRFLFVVPFLILIENIVDKSFVNYIKNTDDIIPDSQQQKFNKLVKRLDKLTDSYIPEILMLIVVYTSLIINWNITSDTAMGRNYILNSSGTYLSLAGWYYILVCMPVFQMLLFRWLWRWLVWLYSIISISRYKLHTDPLNADQMAGLEYLNLVPLTFSFILVAPSAVLSAIIGMDIIYHDAVLKSYTFEILVYIALLPIILYLPLMLFIPFLLHAKSSGIYKFGSLLRQHNSDYAKKWIVNFQANKDKLLGAMDHSSLADINGSYGPIGSIKIIPIDLKLIILSFILNVIVFLPLIFTYYSGKELFKLLIDSMAN